MRKGFITCSSGLQPRDYILAGVASPSMILDQSKIYCICGTTKGLVTGAWGQGEFGNFGFYSFVKYPEF